jgi:predicted transcriptional regulator of viral defense system
LPPSAVAAALSRLAKEGVVRRVRKGVYYSPKKTRFGDLSPDPKEVMAAVFRSRGIEWKPSGLAAYNGLGLTTQVSPTLTLDVPKKIYSLEIGPGNKAHVTANVKLRLGRTVSGLTDEERVILDALRELRRIPDTSPAKAVSRIKDLFATKKHSFNRLAIRALDEPPRVRALLGAIGSEIGASRRALATLRKSLNPMTVFNVGLDSSISTAHAWRIQ